MSAILDENADEIIIRKDKRLSKVLKELKIFVGIGDDFRLTPYDCITIRKNIAIEPYTYFEETNVISTLGFASYTHSPCWNVVVGRYCSIATGLHVMGMRHPIERITSSGITFDNAKPHYRAIYRDFNLDKDNISNPEVALMGPDPVVEHDVWIGMNVTLARGIRLHSGCVVAAGAVVTKDVPPYAVVGGNPAKLIKFRFSEKMIYRLIASSWWERNPSVIDLDLRSSPELFLDKLEELKNDYFFFTQYNWKNLTSYIG